MESPQIDELLRNNDGPSSDIAQEIHRLLTGPRKELADLDADIYYLEGRLKELQIRRNTVQESISRYSIILSPIRAVPVDILHEIFFHCLPTHRNPTMQTTEFPMLLTRVCSTWRTTALSSPRLWARLYITFSDEDAIPNRPVANELVTHRNWINCMPFKDLQQIATQSLQRRCNAIKECFARSGACPLSISVCYTSLANSFNNTPSIPALSESTLELCRILASFAQRWQDVEMTLPLQVYRCLSGMVNESGLNMLSNLRAEIHRPMSLNFMGERDLIELLSARNLKKSQSVPDAPLVWRNLEEISCHVYLSVSYVIFLLNIFPGLIRFTVKITPDDDDNPEATSCHDSIRLHCLRALCIDEADVERQYLDNLYERIDASHLRWMDYTKRDFIIAGLNETLPIIPLLQQATFLEKISVDVAGLTRLDMRQVLQSVGSITHLVIGDEKRTSDAIYLDDSWTFDANDLTLLPRLEILEISSWTLQLRDEDLKKFIIDYMDLGSPSATFKKVTVMFNHWKSAEVAQSIRQHAEHLGLDIKVAFEISVRYLERFIPELWTTA